MFKNVIVTAVRIAFKQKLITMLNILGIALGIAVSIVLIVHIRYETSYDKHIPGVDRVYRITNRIFGENPRHWATTSTPMFHEITEFFPEIEHAARLRSVGNFSLSYENEKGEIIRFEETNGFNADSTIFDVLGIELISGNPIDFYEDMLSLVVTESMAKRYFGDDDPMGRQLKIEGGDNYLTIKGVIPDCPENSHLNYTFFFPYKAFEARMVYGGYADLYYSKGWAGLYNYIRLKENTSFESVRDRMDDFTVHYYEPVYEDSSDILANQLLVLQPVQDIHLHSNLEEEIQVNGNSTYIYVFLVSLIFILIVVGTNYVNLATSLALKRTKEIGIRKILGASMGSIIKTLSVEFLILVIISNILAWLPAYFLMSNWLDDFAYRTGLPIWIFAAATLISFFIAFLTISFQAVKAARANPVEAIKYE